MRYLKTITMLWLAILICHTVNAATYDNHKKLIPESTIQLAPESDSGTRGDNITNQRTFTITGTVQAGTTKIVVLLNDNPLATPTISADNTWQMAYNASADGTYTFQTEDSDNPGILSPKLAVTVDTQRPTATIQVTESILITNTTSKVTFTFSKAVKGFTTADLLVGNGTISMPTTADGGVIWTATLTPRADNTSFGNKITLANAGVSDMADNVGAGTTPSNTYDIDTQPPSLLSFVFETPTLKSGSYSNVTITFSEAITSFSNADITPANGTLTPVSSADGGITYTARFTPTDNITSATNVITIDQTGFADLSGNNGHGEAYSDNYSIDTQPPTTTSIVVATTNIGTDHTSDVTFTFSEAIRGLSAADLTIGNGSIINLTTTDHITYTATFIPTLNNNSTDNRITLNNVAILDLAGNPGSGSTSSNAYNIDDYPPFMYMYSATTNNNNMFRAQLGDIVTFIFAPTEPTQTPVITIAGHNVVATAADDKWTTSYTFQSTDLEGPVTYHITYTDLAGNVGEPLTGTSYVIFDKTAPIKPTGFSAAGSDGTVTFNWTANPETDLDAYKIFSGTSPTTIDTYYVLAHPGETSSSARGFANGTTYYFQILAIDNAGNISERSAITSATPKADQSITFAAIPPKTYGDIPFNIGSVNSSEGLLITYTADDPTKVSITGNMVTVLKPGTVTITASQPGTSTTNPATAVRQTFSISPKTLTITPNNLTKTYGETLVFTGTEFSAPGLVAGDLSMVSISSAGAAATANVANYDILATATGPGLSNYDIRYATGELKVNKKVLTIKAEDKVRFAGTANPILTAIYSGFALNQDSTVLKTLPVITTLADLNSPVGTYDIDASAAVATNYSFDYKKGTLTVKPGAPKSITLIPVDLFENKPTGTNAGTLSSTSDDANATFSYTLVAGTGDTDNGSFSITGNQIKTTKILDFETKSAYKIRVRSTTQNNLWLDKELTILVIDVNEIPTLAPIANQAICYTSAAQTVALTGISAGPESTQTTTLTVSSSNAALFESLTPTAPNGTTATVNYKVKAGASGTATTTVTVKDNGGTANGGVDTYSTTFVITVNAMPVVAINSDKGAQISKGEEVYLSATGAASYAWTDNNSIQSGRNTATIKVRPLETTTYTVTATNATGCSETKTFTITVLDDVAKVKAMNIMSPNGDGLNDKWLIDNIDAYPNNEVKIFDKSGRMMYSKKGYDNSWDATLNGAPLTEGTYYYVIDFGPNKPKVKGFITITKSN